MEVIDEIDHKIGDTNVILSSMKTLYIPKSQLLVIADAHLGKIHHFRKASIAVPLNAAYKDLIQLDKCFTHYKPKNVLFLGDLFHSNYNNFVEEFKSFRNQYHKIDFTLAIGNHDIMDEKIYNSLGIKTIEKYTDENLLFTHEPIEEEISCYNICGHIHPGVTMKGIGKQSITLPCFYFGNHYGLLPAFGYFTGLTKIKVSKEDQVYLITGEKIIAVSKSHQK
jgi:DNA ligase-associated metallophosphoesterase